MRINFTRSLAAGIIGTVAFDLVGFALTGTFWDIPALLGSKLFGEGSLVAGVLAHYTNGVVLAVLYGAIAPSLWGNRWARATTFVTAQTIFGVWLFMAPLLGGGPLGLEFGVMFPVIALVRHWAYGAVLAALYPLPIDRNTSASRIPVGPQPA